MMKTLVEALIGKHNIDNAEINVFSKKYLQIGTIVMFRDGTLGVYVEGSFGRKMAKIFNFRGVENKWFICYDESIRHNSCFYNEFNLNDSLKDYANNDFDIIRIYNKPLKEQDILDFNYKNFYISVNKLLPSKYYERK